MTRWPAFRGTALLCAVAVWPVACGAETPPVEADGRALLSKLDTQFNAGLGEPYAGLFAAEAHLDGEFAAMARVIDHEGRLHQKSELRGFGAIDDVGVIRATVTVSITDGAPEQSTQRECYIAFEGRGDDARILVYDQVDPMAWDHLPDHITGVYSCPACNFRIGADSLMDWLIVPSPTRISGCIEMISFYRPGEDVRLTLSVHRNDQHLPANDHLQKLATVVLPEGERVDVEDWQPPQFSKHLPTGVMGAQCTVITDGGDTHQRRYLISRQLGAATGPHDEISYLMTVHGDPTALDTLMSDIDTWIMSFQFVDPELAPDQVGHTAHAAHTGGHLNDEGRYENARFGLAVQGPYGWRGSVAGGCCLFGVTFSCPEEANFVHVAAYEALPGELEHRRAAAEQQVLDALKEAGRRVVTDSGWLPPTDGHSALAIRKIESHAADQPKRLDHVMVFDDLLVVVDGLVHHDAAARAMQAVIESLER